MAADRSGTMILHSNAVTSARRAPVRRSRCYSGHCCCTGTSVLGTTQVQTVRAQIAVVPTSPDHPFGIDDAGAEAGGTNAAARELIADGDPFPAIDVGTGALRPSTKRDA